MATGYIRQSAGVIVTGNTIQASHFNNEFERLEDAFDATTGHSHDGTVGGGALLAPTALTGLSSDGFVVRTSAGAFTARTITGTANEVTVTNGNGVSANPILSLPAALTFTGKTITGGTLNALTQLGLRSTGAAFDLRLGSSEVLTANRQLSFVLGDTARTLTIGAAASVSGTNTGDQTTISGNAGTATALATPRNINTVPFDGTADITVTAAAGTLTGTTLAANVVNSSLTSVGTITSGTWSGSFGAVSGANLTDLTAANISPGTANINISGNAATATNATTSVTASSIPYTPASNVNPAYLDFAEDTDNGTNRVRLYAPDSLAASPDVVLPSTSGTLATLTGTEALTNKTVNGVTLTTGGSATSYLNGTGTYTAVTSGPPIPTNTAGVGQWDDVQGSVSAAYTLPAGGTWAYFLIHVNASSGIVSGSIKAAGVAAGGTAVGVAQANFLWTGFIWRIA